MAGSPTTQTLVASTVLTVTLTGEWQFVRIIPLSVATDVYVSVDGTNPTVGGDGFVLCPMGASTKVRVPWASGSTVVKLISSAAGTVAVEGCRDRDEDEGDVYRIAVAGGFPASPQSGSISGKAAHSAAVSGNPVYVGGRVTSTLDTSLVEGDASAVMMTTAGQTIVKPYASGENDWQYTGALTTNVAVAAKAAGAASIRNYVASLQVQNTSATATTFLLQDGASTIFQISLPASMTLPVTVNFSSPLRGTAATAMNVNCGTTGANVLTNVQGYQSF